MYQHSASISDLEPSARTSWAATHEQLIGSIVLLDACALIGTALLSDGLLNLAIAGPRGDAAMVAAVAAIPTALLLPGLYIQGAYHPDAILHPAPMARKLVPIWTAALLFLMVLVYCLRIADSLDYTGLTIFAVVAPAAVVLLRRVTANVARSALAAGKLRPRRVFVISDGTTSGFPERSAARLHARVMTIASLAEVDRSVLDQVLASVRDSDAEEIHLLSSRCLLTDCGLLLSELRKVPLPVRLVADAHQAVLLRHRIVKTSDVFSFELQKAPLSASERAVKRTFDVVGSVALCAALLPVMLAIAVMVRLTSPGPALFTQRRNGFNGRPFTIYKFRTMSVQENGPTIVQARRADPRITPLGRVLRLTSVDELPQLINVLRGEMSLIGPRPHAMAHDTEFAARVADYALRHHVKPGITGLAQVSGHRGETTTSEAIAQRVEADLRYIERWSIWLDLWIILQTVRAVVIPKNAY